MCTACSDCPAGFYFIIKKIGGLDMNKKIEYNGLSFSSVLFLIFLVLKLCHVINWPWILVLAPIWLPFVIFIFVTIIMFLIALFLNK